MLLIGIDVGTTSVKGILIDNSGNILGEASQEHDLVSAHAGWAEENPEAWWEGTINVIRKLSDLSKADGRRVAALAVSGMVPALILLDSDGRPVRRSIQQNDARAYEEIGLLKGLLDEDQVFSLTGGGINQQTIPPKLLWLQKNESAGFGSAKYILGSYDYITYRLTGRLTLERNWALESGMFNIHTGEWIPEIIEAAGISEEMLPQVMAPAQVAGTLRKEVADAVGLTPNVVVAVGSGDHVASAFSSGVRDDGDVLIKFGGAGDILLCSNELVCDRRVFIDYHLIPQKFLPNGCMASSGSLVKWFTNTFFKEQKDKYEAGGGNFYAYLDEQSRTVPAGSEGLIALPYFIGEKTPIMDPLARGVFFGLSTYHTAAHMYRSILEAVGLGFLHHVRVFEEMRLLPRRYFMSNGGAKSTLWRQIVTDILGQEVEYITHHPGSSLGAAFVAGMAVGAFASWEDISWYIKDRAVITPDPPNHEIYVHCFEIYRNLYEHLRCDFRDLSAMSLSGCTD